MSSRVGQLQQGVVPATTTMQSDHGLPDSNRVLSLATRLEQSFAQHASLPAIEGKQALLTYGELDRESGALARALASAGVRPGDFVPLFIRRSTALVVAEVAVVRLGAAYAPIDMTSPISRQQAMLAALDAKVLVTDGFCALPERAGCTVLRLDTIADLPADDAVPFWAEQQESAAAYVMFTSGTTGEPKGVVIPQSGIVRLVCDATYADFRPGARWAFLSSPAFDASTLEVWAPLLNGGCCLVHDELHPSIDDIAEFMQANSITDAWLTSTLFSAMVDDRPDAFGGVRQILTGGERVSPLHARIILNAYPDLRLINGYGPTENTTFTLCHSISIEDTTNTNGIPIGKPINGTEVRVDAGETGEAQGELLAGGLGVALEYLHDAVLTAAKFVFINNKRWYRTGDLVRQRDDGVFEFLGRVDRQVKLQGQRIEIDEVERAINACPGVGQSAVVVQGQSAQTQHLVAFYTGRGVSPPPREVVSAYLSKHLPARSLPRVIVPLGELPRTSNGKVDSASLQRWSVRTSGDHPAVAPAVVSRATNEPLRTETEQQLAEIWQRYFPQARIESRSDFQQLGGTSLVALQVSAQVRRHLGRDLSPIEVLRTPVLFEQAMRIESAPPFDAIELQSLHGEPHFPLTQAQQTMLSSEQLDDSGCAFLVHTALSLPGPTNKTAIKHAFETLAERHPSLRLGIETGGQSSQARVNQSLAAGWWQEHGALSTAPADMRWPESLLRTINRPLSHAHLGVMRVDFWPVANGTSLLVWTTHHVAVDEASINRCLEELHTLLRGETLSPVYGSPMGFAPFEKSLIDRGALREWPSRLVRALKNTPAPLPRSPSIGNEIPVAVPDALTVQLQSATTAWGMTPFAPLLAAYGLAVQDIFGSATRFVSTPFSRRAEAELVEPVGCLLDLRLVEAGALPGESESALLRRLNDEALKLQHTSFFPHSAVVEAVARLDATVAPHLNAFGFTWRVDSSRALPFGSQTAQLLRVPQQGARFGITLHASLNNGKFGCTVEAVQAAIDDGRALAVANRFLERLDALLRETPAPLVTQAHAFPAETPSPQLRDNLRRAWVSLVSVPEREVNAESNFLLHGGNSLGAMRLAARLRRLHGTNINVGAFLANPTFANLCALAVEPNTRVPSCSVVIGAVDAPNIIVVFPGDLGPALGSYTLAHELQRRLGDQHAIAIVDLETMLMRAPEDGLVNFLRERIAQLIVEIRAERIVGLAGFSSGGFFALSIAENLLDSQHVPVWLIDTYAPIGRVHKGLHQLLRRTARPVARALYKSKTLAGLLEGRVPRPADIPLRAPATTMETLRSRVHEQLFREWRAPRVQKVFLVQALETVREVRLLWNRATNGFGAGAKERWTVHRLQGRHQDLPGKLAAETAELMRRELQKR